MISSKGITASPYDFFAVIGNALTRTDLSVMVTRAP